MTTRSNGRTSSTLERASKRELSVEPERLTTADLAYHTRVVREYQEATERLRQAQAEATAVEGAMQSWMRHVTSAYGLTVNDAVEMDGVIRRAAQEKDS